MSFKSVFLTILISSLIAFFIGGQTLAIVIGLISFAVCLKVMWDDRDGELTNKIEQSKSRNKNIKKTNTVTPYNNQVADTPDFHKRYIDKTESDKRSGESKPRYNFIDQIHFEYKTKEDVQDFYTVNVYKGINGNIEGWCHERDAVRQFRKDRIINGLITRTETGESMTIKEWRKIAINIAKTA